MKIRVALAIALGALFAVIADCILREDLAPAPIVKPTYQPAKSTILRKMT